MASWLNTHENIPLVLPLCAALSLKLKNWLGDAQNMRDKLLSFIDPHINPDHYEESKQYSYYDETQPLHCRIAVAVTELKRIVHSMYGCLDYFVDYSLYVLNEEYTKPYEEGYITLLGWEDSLIHQCMNIPETQYEVMDFNWESGGEFICELRGHLEEVEDEAKKAELTKFLRDYQEKAEEFMDFLCTVSDFDEDFDEIVETLKLPVASDEVEAEIHQDIYAAMKDQRVEKEEWIETRRQLNRGAPHACLIRARYCVPNPDVANQQIDVNMCM